MALGTLVRVVLKDHSGLGVRVEAERRNGITPFGSCLGNPFEREMIVAWIPQYSILAGKI